MELKKLLLAASVAAAFSTAGVANAATPLTFSNGVASFAYSFTASSFDEVYTFSLASASTATASAITGFVINFTPPSMVSVTDTVAFTSFNIYSGLLGTGTPLAIGSVSALYNPAGIAVVGAPGLLGGDYSIRVTGTAINGLSGNYSGNVNLVTAVPEPESYAMLLAGLGLMGTIARRRSKAAKS